MPVALFAQVWTSCVGPAVAIETGAAVARTESGFDTLVIHDNTAGRHYAPASLAEAIAVATRLRSAGDSLDLGVMQINSANLAHLRLTIAGAFDPCRNMAAGAQILVDDYLEGRAGQDLQVRLRQALSRYNTGNSAAGFANGYVDRVQVAAEQIVPAIRLERHASQNALANDRHSDGSQNAGVDTATLIDGLIHPDARATGAAVVPGDGDDALIHPGDVPPLRDSPSAPPPSHASPEPSG